MDIFEKLDEIRQKPQHIRIRYVWISVGVSMFFIFIIWLFSLQMLFQKESTTEKANALENIKDSFKEISSQKPSLQDIQTSSEGLLQQSENIQEKNQQQ